MHSLEGHFLIAAPQMADANFERSVVLVVQHNPNGAFGIVVNRPSEIRLDELWEKIDESPCISDQYVAVGGPVDGPLLVLHTDSTHSESEVLPGVHIASEKDNVRHVVINQIVPYRVFTGYSGWGSGQLESEFEFGGWLATPATKELVFDADVAELWQKVVHIVGKGFFEDTLGINEFPNRPDVN